MVVEARIAARAAIGDPGLPEMLIEVLRQAGLPTTVPAAMASDAILEATRSDKKAREGVVEYALPAKLGVMAGADRGFGMPVSDAMVRAALDNSR
jgi:3-dehydroquinate synthase